MSNNIRILLNETPPLLFPNSEISGKVIVEPYAVNPLDDPEPLRVNEICIKLIGEVSVSFGYQSNLTREYSDKEFPCKNEKVLWKPKAGKLGIVTETLVFPFSLSLPESCPPTVKVKDGKIEYSLIAELKTPTSMSNASGYKIFHIDLKIGIPPINLNILQLHQFEKCLTKEYRGLTITVSSWQDIRVSFASFKASILATAFTLGETIPVSFKVTNTNSDDRCTIKSCVLGIVNCIGKFNYDPIRNFVSPNHRVHKSSVQKYGSCQDNFNVRFCKQASETNLLRLQIHEDRVATFVQTIKIPQNIVPSFGENSIIKLEYILDVRIN